MFSVHSINIAVRASRRDFMATVPGVPINPAAVAVLHGWFRFHKSSYNVGFALTFSQVACEEAKLGLLLRHVGSHLVSLTIVTLAQYNRQAERGLNHE